MTHIIMKASEVLGSIEIARLDCTEKRSRILKRLEELHDVAERGEHWQHTSEALAEHSKDTAEYKGKLDVLEDMCKFSPDGNIALDTNTFRMMKPFIRTL